MSTPAMKASQSPPSPMVLFGLVTIALSEVLRRHFLIAYGSETHTTTRYILLLGSFFAVLCLCFQKPRAEDG